MDQVAFKAFYEKTAPRLRAYIARSCGSIDAADDILQETYLKFLGSQNKTNDRAMTAYLYRTANTLIIDGWRKRQREMANSIEFVPSDSAPSHDVYDDVKSAFAQLKPQQRFLLWLAYVEEYDHREIAAAARVEENSVRVLLFRARKALLGLLRRDGIGPEVA